MVWQYGITMAMVKVTFSLALETVAMLNDAADRLGKPKSRVVRDAIQEYHTRTDRLTEAERIRMLAAFDDLSSKLPPRADEDVERELKEIRASRCAGNRAKKAE